MRNWLLITSALLLTGILTVASADTLLVPSAVLAGDAGRPVTIKRTVYLNHVVLEELKKSDPERYAQVRQVMAAASEFCANNAGRLWSVANVQSASCSGAFLKPSFPAKREVGFRVDDTWYIALVTVREKPALLVPGPDKIVPAIRAK